MQLQRRRSGRRGNGEGSSDTHNGYYRHRVTLQDGSRREINAKTREELNAKIEALTVARYHGELVTSGRYTFAQWLDQWLEDQIKPNLAVTTYERYRGIANNRVKDKLGRIRLDQLDTPHVQRFYRQLHEAGLSRPTVDLIHSVIHHSLEDARRLRLVGRNVAADARKLGSRRDRDATDRALTEDQLVVLDRAIVGHRHEWLWRTMLLTGLRSGEACALKWAAVDLRRRQLVVRVNYRRALSGPVLGVPKTARSRRTLPLPQQVVDALTHQRQLVREMRMVAAIWNDQDLVFPNSLGRPLRGDRVLQLFQAVLRGAGLPKKRIHDLRHTYATLLYQQDAHPRAVQELLGHSRLEMTMDLYTGSVPAVLEQTVSRLEGLAFGSSTAEAAAIGTEDARARQARLRANARRAAGGASVRQRRST